LFGRGKIPSVLRSRRLAPIFAQPKSEKRLQRAESPTETLATQARFRRSGLEKLAEKSFPTRRKTFDDEVLTHCNTGSNGH